MNSRTLHKPKFSVPFAGRTGILYRPIVKVAACIATCIVYASEGHPFFLQYSLDECRGRIAADTVQSVIFDVRFLARLPDKRRIIGISTFCFKNHLVGALAGITQRRGGVAQVIQNSKMDDEIDLLTLQRQWLVAIVLQGHYCRIALLNLHDVNFATFEAYHLRTEHREKISDITESSSQLSDNFASEIFVSVMVEHRLNALGLPFMISGAESLLFSSQFFPTPFQPSFDPKAHNDRCL